MTRTLSYVTALLCLALASFPALAQYISPQPLSLKYRDAGAKPATGRSGSAVLQARALLGSAGVGDIEVTTGDFGAPSAPGRLNKVQVKVYQAGDALLRVDNYHPPTGGQATFPYQGLSRGQKVQVQANVGGIDAKRTDVVTLATSVLLRPDLRAVALHAPARTTVDGPVVVSGTVSEINGDVGAHMICRLFVDGVEIAAIPGAWVDAASTVSCQFDASFATPGMRQLKMAVDGVAPADYDAANNEASTSIEVVAPSGSFEIMMASASDYEWDNLFHELYRFEGSDGRVSTSLRELDGEGHDQFAQAFAAMPGQSTLQDGHVAFTAGFDGVTQAQVSFDIATMPIAFENDQQICRFGMLASGYSANVCACKPGVGCGAVNQVFVGVMRQAGQAIYRIDRLSSNGVYAWLGNFDRSGTGYDQQVPFLVFGDAFFASLGFQSGAHSATGTVEAAVRSMGNAYDNWGRPECTYWQEMLEGVWGNASRCMQTRQWWRQLDALGQLVN